MSDSFSARTTLTVSDNEYEIYELSALEKRFDIQRLPITLKILLENLLRYEDGITVTAEQDEQA